jgi:hypothetical protein
MPLTAGALDKIRSFTLGTVNFVELQINATKNGVNAGASETISEGELSRKVHTREPRFYLFKSGGKTYFIFSCPDTAPPQLKMVYSSSKSSVADGTKVSFTHKLEIREPSEVTSDALRGSSTSHGSGSGGASLASAMGGKKPPPGVVGRAGGSWEGSTAPNAKQVTGAKVDSSSPHPIYSLISSGGSPGQSPEQSRSPHRKTIVIPPKGAY